VDTETPEGPEPWTVGQVAALAGVSVRTLHHYDEIGLLRPSGRTHGGYRTYSVADLERLAQVVAYRELGFSLEQVAAVLDGDASTADHLREQHRLLRARITRLERMLAGVEKAMEAEQMGIALTPEERFELFGPHDEERAAEAEQRWGDTDAWKQSQRRASTYAKDDWVRIKAEAEQVTGELAAALRSGDPATSARAMDLAEAHRAHISRWFYDCSPAMHRGLAEMYVADPRFTATYDQVEPGLAAYVHDAILANADRLDADS